MATRIEKTDLARDALYDKVNVMIDEVNTKIDNKDSLPSQTGKAGKFLTTDGTNASWGEVKQIEIKQDLTNPSADTVPSTKAVSDESSRITTLMNTKVSNCITYIPQDIKLELNNGTLTLKAGSKVYVPNGIGVFDEITVAADVILDSSLTSTYSNGDYLWSYNPILNKIQGGNNVYNQCQSGTYDGTEYCMFYDTTNNIIKYTSNSGTTWENGYSLPFTLTTLTNGTGVTSIDQVFNGFGYIGSTVFALPGVKGLIPNGRNEDGSLKSIEFTLDKVSITTNGGSTDTRNIVLNSNGVLNHPELSGYLYDENFFWSMNYNGSNYVKGDIMCVGPVEYSSGKVTSFTPKTSFHALDYNDKSTISGWSMPSSRYIDLTPAHGQNYIAPANGYFALQGYMSGATFGNTLGLYNQTKKMGMSVQTPESDISQRSTFVPVSRGDTVTVYCYSATVTQFRFIYAEGE